MITLSALPFLQLYLLGAACSASARPITKSRLEFVTDERFADFDAARRACRARGGTVARPRDEYERKAFHYTAGVHDGLAGEALIEVDELHRR